MRAATLIVGAIAASSVLIALAFILSGGGSTDAVKTRTVTEAAKPSAEEPSPQEAGGAPAGGLAECNGGEFTVENVSCAIGEDIHRQYEEGSRGEFIAIDEEAGETITMTCEVSTPVICTGPGGAAVYFAP